MKKKLSVIVSCYNEEETIPHFYEEIIKVADDMKKDFNFEFLFVNDGSKDKTLEILKKYAKKDERVRFISFSRNFGKESAMYAGMSNAKGDYITLMDADLQHPPKLLIKMWEMIKKDGYDQVATKRANRKGEAAIRSFFARTFYKIINKISKTEMVDGACDYRLMSKQVVNSILEMGEYNRYSKGIFSFVGYNTAWIEFDNVERVAGETKWSFVNLFKYAVEGILSFSVFPLYLSIFFGLIACLISFVMIIFIIIKTLLVGDPVAGWPSTICAILFVGGVILSCLGIQGQYVAKTYLEIKNRPIYIIKETEQDVK